MCVQVRCRVTCGLDMYARDRQKHETETCPNRLVSPLHDAHTALCLWTRVYDHSFDVAACSRVTAWLSSQTLSPATRR